MTGSNGHRVDFPKRQESFDLNPREPINAEKLRPVSVEELGTAALIPVPSRPIRLAVHWSIIFA